MTRDEAARAIGVAVTEIKSASADETEHGVAVVMSNGAKRLVVPGDGFYSLDDHPANERLRRWAPPESADDPEAPVDDGGEIGGQGEGGEDELVVPDGSIELIMEWVGDNPDKARAALAAEQAKASPRKSLIDRLEKVEKAP